MTFTAPAPLLIDPSNDDGLVHLMCCADGTLRLCGPRDPAVDLVDAEPNCVVCLSVEHHLHVTGCPHGHTCPPTKEPCP